jgi:hypothetical protein
MHAEYFLVNNGCNRKTVKTISERLPQLDVVATLAFIVETIYSVNRGTLVIASKQEEVLWVLALVGKQQTNRFKRLFASVNVIAEEQVVRIWRVATILKESQQIEVLPMDVAWK